ncbi:unnamed protein product [Zymoseptoria tritici ST99CH_3D1]|nr:unnamed protein product [Zymoseptoria tritici ST99CH_3D1]
MNHLLNSSLFFDEQQGGEKMKTYGKLGSGNEENQAPGDDRDIVQQYKHHGSPDIGPPAVAHFEFNGQESEPKEVSPPPIVDEDLLPTVNLETRRKRKDSTSKVDMRRSSILAQSPMKPENSIADQASKKSLGRQVLPVLGPTTTTTTTTNVPKPSISNEKLPWRKYSVDITMVTATQFNEMEREMFIRAVSRRILCARPLRFFWRSFEFGQGRKHDGAPSFGRSPGPAKTSRSSARRKNLREADMHERAEEHGEEPYDEIQ